MPLPDCFNPHLRGQDPIDPVAEDENFFGKAPMLEPGTTPEIVRAAREARAAMKPAAKAEENG